MIFANNFKSWNDPNLCPYPKLIWSSTDKLDRLVLHISGGPFTPVEIALTQVVNLFRETVFIIILEKICSIGMQIVVLSRKASVRNWTSVKHSLCTANCKYSDFRVGMVGHHIMINSPAKGWIEHGVSWSVIFSTWPMKDVLMKLWPASTFARKCISYILQMQSWMGLLV